MTPAEMKSAIAAMVDEDYENWVSQYQPIKQTGRSGLKAVEKAGDEFSWTTIDEFVQDYLTLSDGTELSYVAVGITTGIHDGELFFTSDSSWLAADDEDRTVNIEVVVTCQQCLGNSAGCDLCGNSGEWVFLPKAWQV